MTSSWIQVWHCTCTVGGSGSSSPLPFVYWPFSFQSYFAFNSLRLSDAYIYIYIYILISFIKQIKQHWYFIFASVLTCPVWSLSLRVYRVTSKVKSRFYCHRMIDKKLRKSCYGSIERPLWTHLYTNVCDFQLGIWLDAQNVHFQALLRACNIITVMSALLTWYQFNQHLGKLTYPNKPSVFVSWNDQHSRVWQQRCGEEWTLRLGLNVNANAEALNLTKSQYYRVCWLFVYKNGYYINHKLLLQATLRYVYWQHSRSTYHG